MGIIRAEPIAFRLCHELEGLLEGIKADEVIHPQEVDRLVRWLAEVQPYRELLPFSELAPHVEHALADGHVSMEEAADLLFVTTHLTRSNPYFDQVRASIQVLMGIITGMSCDRVVNAAELAALQDWIEQGTHLKGMWPYDECETIAVMAMTQPSPEIAAHLFALSSQFPVAGHVDMETGELPPMVVKGICAVDPKVEFAGKQFVITGDSKRMERPAMEEVVRKYDGMPHPRVTQKTTYLVVCDGGNPLWAFGCYGRKVEQAYNLRREGHPIVIMHERDFWDAVVEHEG